jgi:hypothetical protein
MTFADTMVLARENPIRTLLTRESFPRPAKESLCTQAAVIAERSP